MKINQALVALALVIVVLALFAAGVGLFYQDGGSPQSFTTLRGKSVQLYGQGLYRNDTMIPALSFKMGDLTTLVVAIPMLVAGLVLYRRGSFRGGLVLCGALAFLLYSYASMAFGAAYNNLFVVYIALLAASLCGLVLALDSFDRASLPARFSPALPRRGIGIFLVVTAILLALIWLLMIVIPALLEGRAPDVIESYTTFMTGVMDVGIVAPALGIVGWLLLRRRPAAFLLAAMMLIGIVPLGISITLAGIAQLQAGVVTMGQFIGMTLSFTVLTLFALWFAVAMLRSVRSQPDATRLGARAPAKA